MSEGITANQLETGVVSIFARTTVLNNDQIKALRTTPVELLPLPGAGKAYYVLGFVATGDCVAGAYTFTGSALLKLRPTAILGGGTFAEDSAEAYPVIGSGNAEKVSASVRGLFVSGGDGSQTELNFENKSIEIEFAGAGTPGVFSGGHASNTLTIVIVYTIIDV